jgi:hypothetical protein
MAVYVDEAVWEWRGKLWCHLLADDLDELHAFARRLGMRRGWFQCPPKASKPHYDLTEGRRALAIKLGAKPIGRRETVERARALLAQWEQRRMSAPAQGELLPMPEKAGA